MKQPRALRATQPGAARARGLTLVELLVGLVLGLFLVWQGLALLTTHLIENRALLLQARLTQDLRTAALAIARDLRRAGYWGDAGAGLWQEDSAARTNPYRTFTPESTPTDNLRLHYSRDAVENDRIDSNEQFGYRLRNHAVDVLLGGNWQTLTDAGTVRVTALRISPQRFEIEQPDLCEKPCPPAGPDVAACPPRIAVTQVGVEIRGESAIDRTLKRSVKTGVRLRNDTVTGACP